jgi:hypothetical protein
MSLVGMKESGPFADFELREVDPKSFPVELVKLVPLSGRVRSKEAAWLETPRRFIPGYAASVDGHKARVGDSPEGSVMIEIPAGEHDFRLRYPGSTLLLAAFWTSFSTGCLLALGALGWLAIRASLQVRSASLQVRGGKGVTPSP